MATQPVFTLPSSLPAWPTGGGFAGGVINLGGGLLVAQASSFTKIWATREGGSGNSGATFYAPAAVPDGFFVLGHYGQPNNRKLDGWVLVAKEEKENGGVLAKPADFSLAWSSASSGVKQDGDGYVWYPIPPDGYSAVGCVVSTSSGKPSLDAVRCVRIDLTDRCESDALLWSFGKATDKNAVTITSLRPAIRGTEAIGVPVGTFGVSSSKISCLKNTNPLLTYMPNLEQITAVYNEYSPVIYFHPDEKYLPSSVSWYFSKGVLLYKKGNESNPEKVTSTGSNLPGGGPSDDAYWIDISGDQPTKETAKKGDLQTSEVYVHVKPMFGGTFTDLATWLFYPFNGPARAKVGVLTIPLGKIGEHAGDWEHATLRVSNFDGSLRRVYCSQHSGGKWYEPSELEFAGGSNKLVLYSSLNGHAMYAKAGLVLQGTTEIGMRNDTAKSEKVLDSGGRFKVMAAEYVPEVVALPWAFYFRAWGPKVTYDVDSEIKNAEKLLVGGIRTSFEKFVKSLPKELLGEESPTGPIAKRSWTGDEV